VPDGVTIAANPRQIVGYWSVDPCSNLFENLELIAGGVGDSAPIPVCGRRKRGDLDSVRVPGNLFLCERIASPHQNDGNRSDPNDGERPQTLQRSSDCSNGGR
jgi:hypothetical protein